MPSDYLEHLTLNTGHTRRSHREEVPPDVLAVVTDRLEWALAEPKTVHPFGAPELMGLRAAADGRALIVSLYVPLSQREAAIADRALAPWSPLITMGVAPRATVGARLWPQLLATVDDPAPGLRAPQAPWSVVAIHPGAEDNLSKLAWIDHVERVIAWAWIERLKRESPAT